ncbi:DUF4252 domain-containing protein [Gilvimarinus sp. SDUM040013]|uniref:DUF4252 domain-containing protein n=1 Tax=Gilvimarinus gilvus TaxID=3058038 RepID=A0ABU4S4P0_9GAMM|nr:DUF4252 domain-containing protein [Gilvimarinus sp. SDUM040013]MDO3384804.1 DUF4252 domain-containing protein [Gilvimarinus sp. SDUM040013]MDX6850863.1 DUF4252 domain-containing protein [Gilvimarinus sp. SDUM040013]
MKKLLITVIGFVLVVGAGVAIATAKSGPDQSHVGYANYSLDNVKGLKSKLSLNLGSWTLKPLIWAASQSDSEEAKFLDNISGLDVNFYDVNAPTEVITSQLGNSLSALEANGWEKIVAVNDAKEYVRILTLTDGDVFKGVLISVINEREAIFINVTGSLHNDDLQHLVAMSNEW